MQFAERINAPVAMTLLGLGGFPASHPLNIGMMGMHGEAWVNHAIQEADLLLAFGMRFDDRVTGNLKTYAPQREEDPRRHRSVRDQQERAAPTPPSSPICARRCASCSSCVEPATTAPWLKYIDSMKGDSAVRDIQALPDNGHLYAPHVINDIWRLTEGQGDRRHRRRSASDVGGAVLPSREPRTLITSGGLGTMGFGLPAAIGAKMARPDAEVWAIVGDGGFQMTQAELSTAAQEGVKVNIAVINNGYLGMVRQWQEFFYERRYAATPLRSPDFVKMAEAHGLRRAARR